MSSVNTDQLSFALNFFRAAQTFSPTVHSLLPSTEPWHSQCSAIETRRSGCRRRALADWARGPIQGLHSPVLPTPSTQGPGCGSAPKALSANPGTVPNGAGVVLERPREALHPRAARLALLWSAESLWGGGHEPRPGAGAAGGGGPGSLKSLE